MNKEDAITCIFCVEHITVLRFEIKQYDIFSPNSTHLHIGKEKILNFRHHRPNPLNHQSRPNESI